jgi:hypothetical protein
MLNSTGLATSDIWHKFCVLLQKVAEDP